MSKIQSLKNTFDKLLASADFETTNQLRYTVAEMMDDVINRIIEIQKEDEGEVKPKRKKPIPKDTIARLGPLSDAIKAAGRDRRGEHLRDEYLEGIMNRNKSDITITMAELKAVEIGEYINVRFVGQSIFMDALEKAQASAHFYPTKGIFRCPYCDFSSTNTGTYKRAGKNQSLRWPSQMDHLTQKHSLLPTEEFMCAIVPPKHQSKVQYR